jgi:hypothetical protein
VTSHPHGGGWVSVKAKEGRVTFFDKSTAYGPFVRDKLVGVLKEITVPNGVTVGMG